MLSSEIRELSIGDIESRIRDLEEERFRLQFRNATEPLEDPLRLRVIRRDVARLKTVLRERQNTNARGAAKATGAKG
jgi:large subunit ribosomal protein L29